MGRRKAFCAFIAACAISGIIGAGLVFGAISVPDSMKDVPLFAGSKLQQSMDMGNTAMVTATVKAKVDAVAEYYKDTMKGKGWKVVFQAQTEEGQVMHFQKDNRVLHVNVQGGDQEGEITYNLVVSSQ